MPLEVQGHTVPHFKAFISGKLEIWRLGCGNIFRFRKLPFKNLISVHKTGFAWFVLGSTVCSYRMQYVNTLFHTRKRYKCTCNLPRRASGVSAWCLLVSLLDSCTTRVWMWRDCDLEGLEMNCFTIKLDTGKSNL